MKIMKRLLVLSMALCLAFGGVVTANAAGSNTSGTPVANTKKNSITVKTKKTIKKSKLKKKNISFNINATAKSKTKITYTKVKTKANCKYIKVSKSGKVTLNKKLVKRCKPKNKTHTLKVKITAAAGNGYKKATKTVTLKIKVK